MKPILVYLRNLCLYCIIIGGIGYPIWDGLILAEIETYTKYILSGSVAMILIPFLLVASNFLFGYLNQPLFRKNYLKHFLLTPSSYILLFLLLTHIKNSGAIYLALIFLGTWVVCAYAGFLAGIVVAEKKQAAKT